MEKNKRIVLNSFLIASFVGVIITAILAFALPINNITPLAVVDKYRNFFSVANYTLLIWIIIYALQVLYILYTFGVYKKQCLNLNALNIASSLTILLNLLCIGLILSVNFEVFLVSTLIAILMFVDLILIATHVVRQRVKGLCELFVYIPFMVYLAWTTVSIFLNLSHMLTAINWNGFNWGFGVWAAIMVGIIAVVSIVLGIYYRNLFYILTVLWAMLGMLINQFVQYSQANSGVLYTIIVSMFLLVLTAALIIYNSAKSQMSDVRPKKK